MILKGVNSADFMRFRGISEGCSNPLEEAGVDTVEELRHRVSGHLHQKMIEVNKKKLVREFPPYLKLRMGCDKRGNCFAT